MRSYGEELIEQGRQQGLAKGLEEGLAKGAMRGRAEFLVRLLAARDIPVDEKDRWRILTCTDMATLDRWFDNALKATSLSEVLDDPAQ